MIFLILAGFLILGGFFHLTPPGSRLDKFLFNRLHPMLRGFPGAALFQQVWFLGRTPLILIFLLMMTTIQVNKGITASVIFLIAVSLERGLKLSLQRERPFHTLNDVHVTQPAEPDDPSFPSGDCLRVWFISILLLHLVPFDWCGGVVVILLALVVTLGRIGMGVHYPLDTLTGSGLGILAAQITVILWQHAPRFPFGWFL